MNLYSWLGKWFSRTPGARRPTPTRRPRKVRLQAERLEDRRVPSITTLASFSGANGAGPYAAPIVDSHGNLFGTTSNGGPFDKGTVYEVAAGSNTITTLASFNGSNSANPWGGLVADSRGNLFGT